MVHPTPAIVYPTLRQGADHGYRATCVHLPRVRHDPNPHLGRIDPVVWQGRGYRPPLRQYER